MDKRNILSLFLWVWMVGLCTMTVHAQEKEEHWGNSRLYFERQAESLFPLVDKALTQCPPSMGDTLVRRLALYSLDALLHDTINDSGKPLERFIHSRMANVIADLNEPLEKGVKVYKIYNDGFLMRTPTVTVAFDLVRGSCKGKALIPDSLICQIVKRSDVLLVTHKHGDHADSYVADLFLKEGKPVIGTTDLWERSKEVVRLRSEEKVLEKSFSLRNGRNVKLTIFPGHQDELMNNIYVVTSPEGYSVAHTGDQYNESDMEWISGVKERIADLDALIVNCWINRIDEVVNGFSPRIVITAHENEMGHTIDHREPFWLTFQKVAHLMTKCSIMGWGEWLQLK